MKRSLVLLAAVLLPVVASSQESRTGANSSPFDALDADKSASIDLAEAKAHPVVLQNFAVADRNGDGALTRDEFDTAFTTTKPPSQSPQP